MKVYTRGGDKGTTSLVGGKRVNKNSLRLEAYGTTDELIAVIALIRDSRIDENILDQLITIQDDLMVVGTALATDESFEQEKIPQIKEHHIVWLEQRIDEFEEELPPLLAFVLPGGEISVSYCHLARTVCRRAERRALDVAEQNEVNPLVLKYLNRLSDYFFMLSRFLSKKNKAKEIIWEPKLG